jgi:N-formylglutamate amidohydrolase
VTSPGEHGDAVASPGEHGDAVTSPGEHGDAVTSPGELFEVQRGAQPILATAIHEGHELRDEVAARMVLPESDRYREEDPHTGTWTAIAANRIIARRSRFEVDLNRPPESAVYRTPDDCWGLEVWREPLPDEVVDRSMTVYRAFHELVRGTLTELEEQHGAFVVFDLHAYNHRRAGPDRPPADPRRNPVVNVGTGNLDRARWAPLVDRFIAELAAIEVAGEPLDVRENVRFRGGHFSKWVTETFPRSGCVLAVEVKKVYMDEWTGEADPEIVADIGQALAATIPGVVESLRLR